MSLVRFAISWKMLLIVACIQLSTEIQDGKTMIYIYNGEGADTSHAQQLKIALERDLSHIYNVTYIYPKDVIKGTWRDTAALYVKPGGYDMGFINALGNQGAEQIRQYVTTGGAFLGVGAGSYYACDRIEFDMGGPQEVVGERPLKFFPGNCPGPVYGPYNYQNRSGARAAPIEFFVYSTDNSQSGPTMNISMQGYFNGGNMFIPYNPDENKNRSRMGTLEHVLAVFVDFEGKPDAMVKCQVGRGVAVLSGVHLEFRSDEYDTTDPYLKPIQQSLAQFEPKRQMAFCSVLKHLRLTTTCYV